ncbi:YihY family inner membrane protein [Oligoflexus tunisiensis]|uniref:YihY family inner membrane protein n=1 Tax=Oligoflexus tunisiensis TaxID=708132 RepID=UPI00159F295E|nr:YihY family inner membrane protein [Oligoflexus tunisiensis]
MPAGLHKIWGFLCTLWHDIKQTNLLLHASSMSYMTLGSIIPFLALTFAIISAFQPIAVPDASWFATFKVFILENLAPSSGQSMVELLETFLANLDVAKIGLTGFMTLIVLIVILLHDIELALNSIWQVPHTRPFLKRFLFFWITTTLGTVCISVVVAAFSQLHVLERLPYSGATAPDAVGGTLSFLVNLAATFVFFTVLHKIGPNCHVSFKAALVGGLSATLMIRLASAGFGLYSTHSQWNQNIYEALAVVPLFLLWLYLAWFVILFSAIIAWRTHHGFRVKRADEAVPSKQIEDEAIHLRDLQVRAVMPLVCVLLVGTRFLKERGAGTLGKNLAVELDAPPYWVREALFIAEELGLVLVKRPAENKDDVANDVLELTVYPGFPLDRISLAEIVDKLSEEARQWFRTRPCSESFPVHRLLERAHASLQKDQGRLPLAALLDPGPA